MDFKGDVILDTMLQSQNDVINFSICIEKNALEEKKSHLKAVS